MHQCGPAALATVLGWSGVAVAPEALAAQVYIPGRQGSLAVELLAAARRSGRIAYQLAPAEAAIRAELQAGAPVLVLQDFGVAGLHAWHFAVVIGIDPELDLVVLRSGAERRRVERRERFLTSWARAGSWALVTLPPERLPASLSAQEVVRTVEEARAFMPAGTAGTAYQAALQRWPADGTVLFASGNEAYAAGRLPEAEVLYRRLLSSAPGHIAARNNLANLLLDRACPRAAGIEARLALEALERDPDAGRQYRDAVRDTLSRSLAAAGAAAPPGTPGC